MTSSAVDAPCIVKTMLRQRSQFNTGVEMCIACFQRSSCCSIGPTPTHCPRLVAAQRCGKQRCKLQRNHPSIATTEQVLVDTTKSVQCLKNETDCWLCTERERSFRYSETKRTIVWFCIFVFVSDKAYLTHSVSTTWGGIDLQNNVHRPLKPPTLASEASPP